MKVLRKSDRVKFKIDGVEFVIAPLSFRDRIELSTSTEKQSGETVTDFMQQTLLLIKKCLKEAKGLKNFDGSDYVLSFEGEELNEDCADELFMCFQSNKAVTALVQAGMGNLAPVEDVEFSVLGK